MPGFLFVAFGILIICWALTEIFSDLFQPAGSGSLSSFLGRHLFNLARRFRALLSIVGPLCVLIVIGLWTLLLTTGFALIYAGFFPAQFGGAATKSFRAHGLVMLLSYSLSELTTVGTPDLVPKTDLLRLLAAVESLLGFSLVTASISWIVLIYPALGRTRALARRASDLFRAEQLAGVKAIGTGAEHMLADFSQQVIRLRVDLIHFPLIYYFHVDVERAALPRP